MSKNSVQNITYDCAGGRAVRRARGAAVGIRVSECSQQEVPCIAAVAAAYHQRLADAFRPHVAARLEVGLRVRVHLEVHPERQHHRRGEERDEASDTLEAHDAGRCTREDGNEDPAARRVRAAGLSSGRPVCVCVRVCVDSRTASTHQ